MRKSMTNDYIEFRVYLKPDIDKSEIVSIAEATRDFLTDQLDDDYLKEFFDGDITYDILFWSEHDNI